MLKLPDRAVDMRQLSGELAALSLPGYRGVARLSRETDDLGKVVLGSDSRPVLTAMYILIKTDALRSAQEAVVRQAVIDHVPALETEKAQLLRSFHVEAARRAGLKVPEWNSVQNLEVAVGMMRAAGLRLTPEQIAARDLYTFAQDARAKLDALTTAAQLELIDPTAADPFSDGSTWPS